MLIISSLYLSMLIITILQYVIAIFELGQKELLVIRIPLKHHITVILLLFQLTLFGYSEGEKTFNFKYLLPYFQVGQHMRSVIVLDAISNFIITLPYQVM